MVSLKAILSAISVASLSSAACGKPTGYSQPKHQCGKTDVFFTGLPANHPLVISQGFDPAFVASALAADKAAIIKAGYNIKTVLRGPEQPESSIANELHLPRGVMWDVAGIGFGLRGAGGPYLNLTIQFEDEIALFRKELPTIPFVFNRSPNTTLEALQRQAPIQGDCSKTPGTDYGTKVFCNICG